MGSSEFHPDDSGSVLHFHNQAVLVAADVEYNPIVAADAGIAVLVLHCLRRQPGCFQRFLDPTFEGALRIAVGRMVPELL